MNFHQYTMIVHNWMECNNITGEPDDDDPLETNIPELEDMRAVEGDAMITNHFLKPLKINIHELEVMHTMEGVGMCEDTPYHVLYELIS